MRVLLDAPSRPIKGGNSWTPPGLTRSILGAGMAAAMTTTAYTAAGPGASPEVNLGNRTAPAGPPVPPRAGAVTTTADGAA